MRFLLAVLLLVLVIGAGMKLAGVRIPILDYPLGGPMAQPHIDVVQPDLDLR